MIKSNLISIIVHHYKSDIETYNSFKDIISSIEFDNKLNVSEVEIGKLIRNPDSSLGYKYNGWKMEIFECLFEKMENIEID